MKDIPVFFETCRVGLLEIGEDGSPSFRYDPRWQASPNAFPISTTMPLGQNLFAPEVIHPLDCESFSRRAASNGGRPQSWAFEHGHSDHSRTDWWRCGWCPSFGSPVPRRAWEYVPLTEFYDEPDSEKALHRHFDDLRRRPFLRKASVFPWRAVRKNPSSP